MRADERRKQQILSAATKCFVSSGYASTRLIDIAKEAGLSKGGVYFHYKAKEQLFIDILDRRIAGISQRWGSDPYASVTADRALLGAVYLHLQAIENDPNEVRLYNMLVAMASQDERFREKLERMTDVIRETYARIIDRGIREGTFPQGDAYSRATALLSMIHGIGSLAALDPSMRIPMPLQDIADCVIGMAHARCNANAVPTPVAAVQTHSHMSGTGAVGPVGGHHVQGHVPAHVGNGHALQTS